MSGRCLTSADGTLTGSVCGSENIASVEFRHARIAGRIARQHRQLMAHLIQLQLQTAGSVARVCASSVCCESTDVRPTPPQFELLVEHRQLRVFICCDVLRRFEICARSDASLTAAVTMFAVSASHAACNWKR